MQKLRNSIGSKFQASFLQLWKTWMMMGTSVGLGENIGENIKNSVKVRLGHYNLKQHKP
jgi:hypothetical protein